MTRDELISRIREANSSGQWQAFVDSIGRADSAADFDAIFGHAVERQAVGSVVLDAAKLLFESNVTCRVSCEQAVNALTANWDISIEEVPWYLTRQFGIVEVLRCVELALAKEPDENARVRFETVQYWAKLCPDDGITNG